MRGSGKHLRLRALQAAACEAQNQRVDVHAREGARLVLPSVVDGFVWECVEGVHIGQACIQRLS